MSEKLSALQTGLIWKKKIIFLEKKEEEKKIMKSKCASGSDWRINVEVKFFLNIFKFA